MSEMRIKSERGFVNDRRLKIKSNSENENNSESEGGKNDYHSPEEKHQQIDEKMMKPENTEMTSQEPGICEIDPWLKPFAPAIKRRLESYKKWINQNEGGYDKFSHGYERFGLNVLPNGDIIYRE
ncbi:hypothetical protein RhiirA5_401535 [Rhizophagus irregularis]|uniref:Uncharacterized protein n=4 Tax=Rhizophagus irregularis TaxID=588596 RepID=A0A2N0PBR6_9GLOM|nr:hypothetical protein RhiirA5_401535 [Rhizophagus irregularis]